MSEPNVLQFERSMAFYLNLSRKCRDKGDELGAIEYAKRAASFDSEEAKLYLARILLDTSHFDKVLDVVNGILARNRKCLEAYRIAFQFFLILDDEYSLLTYVGIGLDYNGDDPEYFKLLEKVQDNSDFDTLLADAQSGDYRLIYSGGEEEKDYSEVEADIFENSMLFFAENRNRLAQEAMDAGNYREAEKYLKEVLEEEPVNIPALCNSVYLCKAEGRDEEADRFLKRLLVLEILSDVNDVYKVASVLCDRNDHELILSYLEKTAKYITPDDRLTEIKAICCYNLRRFKESEALFRELHVVDDSFGIYQYYLRLVDQTLSGERPFEPLVYTDQVPEAEYQFRTRKVELILAMSDEDFSACIDIPENVELLKWSLTMNEDELVSEAVKRMFGSPLEGFLHEMLLYSDISYMVKKEIVCLRLLRGDTEICYTVSDLLRIVKSRFPKRYGEMPDFFKRAFCMAQAVLYFADSPFYLKLARRTGRMYSKWKANPDPDYEDDSALTAALLYLTMSRQYPISMLSRIFRLDESLLRRYIGVYR